VKRDEQARLLASKNLFCDFVRIGLEAVVLFEEAVDVKCLRCDAAEVFPHAFDDGFAFLFAHGRKGAFQMCQSTLVTGIERREQSPACAHQVGGDIHGDEPKQINCESQNDPFEAILVFQALRVFSLSFLSRHFSVDTLDIICSLCRRGSFGPSQPD